MTPKLRYIVVGLGIRIALCAAGAVLLLAVAGGAFWFNFGSLLIATVLMWAMTAENTP